MRSNRNLPEAEMHKCATYLILVPYEWEYNWTGENKNILEQIRDEIRLKAHLGQAEAKDELEQLEKNGMHFSLSTNH